jgi:hypothetical protein
MYFKHSEMIVYLNFVLEKACRFTTVVKIHQERVISPKDKLMYYETTEYNNQELVHSLRRNNTLDMIEMI